MRNFRFFLEEVDCMDCEQERLDRGLKTLPIADACQDCQIMVGGDALCGPDAYLQLLTREFSR